MGILEETDANENISNKDKQCQKKHILFFSKEELLLLPMCWHQCLSLFKHFG